MKAFDLLVGTDGILGYPFFKPMEGTVPDLLYRNPLSLRAEEVGRLRYWPCPPGHKNNDQAIRESR